MADTPWIPDSAPVTARRKVHSSRMRLGAIPPQKLLLPIWALVDGATCEVRQRDPGSTARRLSPGSRGPNQWLMIC